MATGKTALACILAMTACGCGIVNTGSSGNASANSAARIEQYLQNEADVIAQMGVHPKSADVFAQLLTMWCKETGKDAATARQEIALAFPDHELGLYAMRTVIQSDSPEPNNRMAFCRSVVEDMPDKRVACMALEQLVSSGDEASFTLCKQLAETSTRTRVGQFALAQMGDLLASQGDSDAAVAAWLQAWIARPDMGKSLWNKLLVVWLDKGNWLAPLLLNIQALDDPVLNPVKERLLKNTRSSPDQGVRRQVVQSIANALAENDLEKLCDAIDATCAEWSTLQLDEPEKAELALGFFFMSGSSDLNFCFPSHSTFVSKNRFNACRRHALELAQKSMGALGPDLAAAYTLRAADRIMEDLQVNKAMGVLENSWKREGLSKRWRDRLFGRFAEIQAVDNSQPQSAAASYVSYCDLYKDAPPEFTKKAAMLYVQAEDYQDAQAQFELFEHKAANEEETALAVFMIGVCMQHLNSNDTAKGQYQRVVEQLPSTKFAPQALVELGIIALHEGNKDKARELLQEVTLRYPDWKYTKFCAANVAGLSN